VGADLRVYRICSSKSSRQPPPKKCNKVDETRLSCDVNNNSGSGNSDAGATIKAKIAEWIIKEEGQYQVSAVATEINPSIKLNLSISISPATPIHTFA
jgi:hypothetical protein